MLQFLGSAITFDAWLLPYRELDNTLAPTDTASEVLADARAPREWSTPDWQAACCVSDIRMTRWLRGRE